MTNQQQKNRKIILLLFAMTVIPFCIAWYLAKHPEVIATGKTSHGELVIPVITTEKTDFSGFDKFSSENIRQLSGHWVIANVIPNQECTKICQEAIHKSKQLHLMLNKDLTRVRRIVILFKDNDQKKAALWWPQDNRLLRMRVSSVLMNKITQLRKGSVPEGMLFLIDPLGNIMMQYEQGFDPYKVEKDLKKLLNVSQIG